MLRNRALDWLRRPDLEDRKMDYEALLETLPDEAPDPGRLLDNNRDARGLAECLGQLAAKQRQSIVLAYMHGMSHSELARHLGEPLGTTKTWIRRGLQRLKVCMEDKAGEIPNIRDATKQ